jgi:hypothetical protein
MQILTIKNYYCPHTWKNSKENNWRLIQRFFGFKKEMFESLHIDPHIYLLFLNQNYSIHASTIAEIESASEYLSLSDLFLGNWLVDFN